MEKKKFISWRRVSTFKQGRSGLGLEAQKDIIGYFIDAEGGVLVADYEETYTGTDLTGCVKLREAMKHALKIGATLIIAKTDRFRNTREALEIYDYMEGNIYFCDCPAQDKFTLTLMFAIAEREALQVSIRTKAALAAKRLRDGEWAGNYGKHTRTTRDKALEAARDKRAENQRAKAKANPNNARFEEFILFWRRSHDAMPTDAASLEAVVEEAIAFGCKTATGQELTVPRFRAMYSKVKSFMDC